MSKDRKKPPDPPPIEVQKGRAPIKPAALESRRSNASGKFEKRDAATGQPKTTVKESVNQKSKKSVDSPKVNSKKPKK
jgi:hypothetical protein